MASAEDPQTRPVDSEPASDLPGLPLVEDAIEHDRATDEVKPTWRGWIHAGTFPLAAVAGVVLIVLADGAAAKWSSAVFATTSLLMFGTSATYHRFDWRPRTKRLLKRLDHANIFLLIAGTYTPMSVIALPEEKAVLLLSLVWGGALIGIAFRVFWITAPRWLYVPLYLILGWAAVMYLGDLLAVSVTMMLLIVVGGLLYTAGAIIYGLKKPNPVPGVFGFHEIFHTLTVLAFLCHWAAIFVVAVE